MLDNVQGEGGRQKSPYGNKLYLALTVAIWAIVVLRLGNPEDHVSVFCVVTVRLGNPEEYGKSLLV